MRGLTDLERRAIRAGLVAELGRAEEQVASLARQFDDIVAAAEMSNTDDEHDPEGTTIAFERAQVSALQSQASLMLQPMSGRLSASPHHWTG